MGETNIPKSDFDASNLILFLLKWKKVIIGITLLAAVVSAVVSLMIEEKFLSSVIFFPADNSSLSKAVMTEDHAAKNDISSFGEEEQAEAMLQILDSDEIKWNIWGKFNLMDHYEIDRDSKTAGTVLGQTWESNVSYKRTEFNSIRIDVMDKDPKMAANIANEISALVDSTKNKMLRDRAMDALGVIEKEYNNLEVFMQNLDDSLTVLRGLGVHEYDKQVEMLTKAYYESIASNNTRATKILESKLDILAKYGSSYKSMTENLEYLRERYILLKGKYDEVRVDATQTGTHKFIVNKAVPAEKKAYPVRWLIVVTSSMAAFAVTILAIVLYDNYQRFANKA